MALRVLVPAFFMIMLMTSPSSAEWYADLYGGGSFTMNHDIKETSSLGFTAMWSDMKFKTSGTVGGRAGYWFEQLPWYGIGIDVFYFQPTADSQTAVVTIPGLGSAAVPIDKVSLSVIGIGFDVLRLRLPLLKSEEYPHGQLQPYFTAGPAIFKTRIKDTTNFAPGSQSDTDTSLGVKVGAGLSFQVTQWFSLFGEYRFTRFRAEGTFQDMTPPPSQEILKTDLNTHHLIGGVSFRFD